MIQKLATISTAAWFGIAVMIIAAPTKPSSFLSFDDASPSGFALVRAQTTESNSGGGGGDDDNDNDNDEVEVLLGTPQEEGSVLLGNLLDRCVVDFDPNIDYFPVKYEKPNIASYGDVDLFGNKFVPHNTTDFLDISYHNTYKIVTNSHQDPPARYLLYQCGTEPPKDVIENGDFQLVVSVPHKGGLAVTETPQIPYIEMLGLRDQIVAYVGDPIYVTSPCLQYMMATTVGDGDGDGAMMVETVYDSNFTVQPDLIDNLIERHPEIIIFSGPSNNVVGDRVMVASATQERTNVATFDWIAFYAALFNLEGESTRIVNEQQELYDCSSDVAFAAAASSSSRQLEQEDNEKEQQEQAQQRNPVILWANYISYQDLGWSVAECPTWDSAYYCEYAKHCAADILSRPEGFGYNKTWGSPTVYWYVNDTELLEMGKNADVFIYNGDDYDEIYESKKEMFDQIKAVQNKQVFDTQGQGPSAWFEQRYAEYATVGLDMCDIVGRASPSPEKSNHVRRWFRNVFTEPIGSLGECDVPNEIFEPYVPPGREEDCVRPDSIATATAPDGKRGSDGDADGESFVDTEGSQPLDESSVTGEEGGNEASSSLGISAYTAMPLSSFVVTLSFTMIAFVFAVADDL